tara:strand:- start:2955 stop:3119 length:165 start_codon:yes stop_codon:yes gene_type:complete
MTKEKTQYLKKDFDSPDWKQITKTQLHRELLDKEIEVLEKTGRIKTFLAIYQKA